MAKAMTRVIVELRVPKGDMSMVPDLTAALEASYGFQCDREWTVPVQPAEDLRKRKARVMETRICIRGKVPENQVDEMRKGPNVEQVWSDPEIARFNEAQSLELVMPCDKYDCGAGEAKGTLEDVAAYLGVDWVWNNGTKGVNVVIAICDTGVDRMRVLAFDDGWTPNTAFPPGTDSDASFMHGTMCANDASFICPEAKIYDIGVLKGQQGVVATLSDAMMGFQWAIQRYESLDAPLIMSNSWGIYQESWAPDYARNADHPFTRKVKEAVAQGVIVLFAAGNCGPVCPSQRCGTDIGSGRSIWGANGLAEVITIGAANIRDEWIGYSSVGPAAIEEKKPDFCAISHFNGFHEVDTGTSAATPIAAGVVGLLKSTWTDLSGEDIKAALARTCRPLCTEGWDYYAGAGIIQAKAAYQELAGTVGPGAEEFCEALAKAKEKLQGVLRLIEDVLEKCS